MKCSIGSPGVLGIAVVLILGSCQQKQWDRSNHEVHVDVTDAGFDPSDVQVPAGQAVTLVVTRKTDQTCATEIVFLSLNQKHALPLNQPVRIALPASAGGTLSYQCGMNMLSGRITIQ